MAKCPVAHLWEPVFLCILCCRSIDAVLFPAFRAKQRLAMEIASQGGGGGWRGSENLSFSSLSLRNSVPWNFAKGKTSQSRDIKAWNSGILADAHRS